jgi:hypothetical protein
MLKIVASNLDAHSYSFDHRTCNFMWNIKVIYASDSIENLTLFSSSVYLSLYTKFFI